MPRRSRLATLVTLTAVATACSKAPDAAPSPGDATTAGVSKDAGSVAVPSAPQVDETEPNESPETAQLVDHSCVIRGHIDAVQPATRPDEDWFLIQPAQPPQDLTVQLVYGGPLPAEPPNGKFVLEAYGRDHDRIESRTGSLTAGPLTSLPVLRVRDGVYLRVAGSVFPYSLEIHLAPPDLDAEAEPNNRAVDATSLAFDHPMHGSYATEADQDYYVLELVAAVSDAGIPVAVAAAVVPDASAPLAPATPPPPIDAGAVTPPAPPAALAPSDFLRIEVTGIPGVRHSLTLIDEGKTVLGTFGTHEAGEPLLVRDFALRPDLTRVYLLLESFHSRRKSAAAVAPFPAGQAYTVTVHREPAPADLELEPNDTTASATPLVARRVGYLAPAGDIDNYRIHLDAPARVHVTLSALDQVDAELSVVEPDPGNSAGKTLVRVNEGGTKEPEVIPAITLAAGDHFVRVQAAAHKVGAKWVRDQADPDHTYELAVTLAPDDGAFEREPNDSTATATPIAPGQTLSGFAYPAKDLDVYQLDLSAQPVSAGLTFRVTGVAKVPLELELRDGKDHNLGELLNSSDPGKAGADAQFQQKLEPGFYYLVVKAHAPSHDPGVAQSDAETAYKLSVALE